MGGWFPWGMVPESTFRLTSAAGRQALSMAMVNQPRRAEFHVAEPVDNKTRNQSSVRKLEALWLLLNKRFITEWGLIQLWQLLGKLYPERRVEGTKKKSSASSPEALVQGRQVQVAGKSEILLESSKGKLFDMSARSFGLCVVPSL